MEQDTTMLKAAVVEALKNCYDPEIPVDIYELGLIYEVDVKPSGEVGIKMTLTSPRLPGGRVVAGEVEMKVKAVDGVTDASVELVWDPPWDMEMMTEAAKLTLGFL